MPHIHTAEKLHRQHVGLVQSTSDIRHLNGAMHDAASCRKA